MRSDTRPGKPVGQKQHPPHDHSQAYKEPAHDLVDPAFNAVPPADVPAPLIPAIVDTGIEGNVLAKSFIETPEQFEALRGKAGLLGDNKERRLAHHYAQALGNQKTWKRQ
jgi:hypothetical protein